MPRARCAQTLAFAGGICGAARHRGCGSAQPLGCRLFGLFCAILRVLCAKGSLRLTLDTQSRLLSAQPEDRDLQGDRDRRDPRSGSCPGLTPTPQPPAGHEQLEKALGALVTSPGGRWPRFVPAPAPPCPPRRPLVKGQRPPGRDPLTGSPIPADPPCAGCRGTAPWRRRGGAGPCSGRGLRGRAGAGAGRSAGPAAAAAPRSWPRSAPP